MDLPSAPAEVPSRLHFLRVFTLADPVGQFASKLKRSTVNIRNHLSVSCSVPTSVFLLFICIFSFIFVVLGALLAEFFRIYFSRFRNIKEQDNFVIRCLFIILDSLRRFR